MTGVCNSERIASKRAENSCYQIRVSGRSVTRQPPSAPSPLPALPASPSLSSEGRERGTGPEGGAEEDEGSSVTAVRGEGEGEERAEEGR